MSTLSDLFRPKAQNNPPVPLAPLASRTTGLMGTTRAVDTHNMALYGAVGTLYACVSLTSSSLASCCWHLCEKQTDPDAEPVEITTPHPATTVWNRPNDFMSGFEFRERCQQHLDLVGETCMAVEYMPGTNYPAALWPVRPDRITPVPGRDVYLAGYVYTSPDGERIPLATNEILRIMYPNPLDPYRGLGPVQAIMVDADSVRYSAEWNRKFFQNDATPGGIISVPNSLEDREYDRLALWWGERHKGINNAHRVGLLENGATYTQAGFTHKDMAFGELRTMSDNMIREVFRIHPHMLGQSTDVNLANAKAAEHTFSKWTVCERGDRWADMLNTQFLPLFGASGQGVYFGYDSPVQADEAQENANLTTKVNAASVLVASGFDPDMVLEVVGLPPMVYVGPPNAQVPDIAPTSPVDFQGVPA